MNNNHLFADIPVLGLITNFSENGDFEKIFMVVESRPKQRIGSRLRRSLVSPQDRIWNGPDFSSLMEKHGR
jgi:hypothetical protein